MNAVNFTVLSFRRRIKYFIVHCLDLTNRQAEELISTAQISVDKIVVSENVMLDPASEIMVGDKIVRPHKNFLYLKFHKPKGFESTMSKKVADNLAGFFPGAGELAIAGRLDKDSEGLLLLSDNGKWVKEICDPENNKEKEYLVTFESEVRPTLATAFSQPQKIGNRNMKPAICEIIGPKTARIVLTEGANRQIRRISRREGNEVLTLKRVRIGSFNLGDLLPGESIVLDFK
jgi:pseudouridine synthase